MFSKNNRISERQAFRLLTYDMLGLSTLLIPPVLAREAGRDGVFSIVLGVLASLLYLCVINGVIKDCATTFPYYLEQNVGKIGKNVILSGFFLYLISFAGYVAYLFADVVLESLLREESFYLVLVMVLLLVLYGMWGGLEGRARVYEVLFWFLMIPLVLMLFFALDEVSTDYWSPVFVADFSGTFFGTYYVFMCMAIVFLLLFLGAYIQERKSIIKVGKQAVLLVGGVHVVLYLILLGVFGAGALGEMEYPAVTLMSTVQISGGFFKRTDAFIFAVWFFTLYALLASCVYYSGNIFREIFSGCMEKYNEKKCEQGIAIAMVVVTAVIAICFYRERVWMQAYEWLWLYIATPFVVLVPVVLVGCKWLGQGKVVKHVGKRVGCLVLILVLAGMLGGCATAELEDRNFPIELAVTDTDEFPQGFLDSQGTGNRMIDYSHLKVLIFSKAFIEDEASMREFLELMETRNEIPHNTYVVMAEDAKEIMDSEEIIGESVGNYLEQMFENVSEVKKQEYPTLGKLYQEEDNQCETLLIPYVSVGEDSLVVETFYVWRRGEAFGTVDSETAMLSFFTKNQVEDYQLTLKDGDVVSLFESHNDISFSEGEESKLVTAKIHCSGELLNQRSLNMAEKSRLTSQIEYYMNRTAQRAMADGIDITNSFRKLGAERKWYLYYQKHERMYEQDIDIRYEVEIDWVNL